ncbi:peptidyl-prolyl cis-trans isomerase [Labrenzia sp. PHM005]|uniref:peptidylprolyl isomerase n=1 Tax=Labrenzia sp. PHM005 TaxID=2590016 RepID=UPI00114086F0|nr:peptidylprolyl isomerase [Labrenzia sp. PHM005]QDG76055.1 peptidyl-prolyl cis-trans isomerase [Labrenzia sp. PHM005]
MTSSSPPAKTSPNEPPKQSIFQRIIREPLLHFLLLASALFAVQGFVGSDEKELIVVDAQAQKYLFKQEENLRLRPLTKDDQQRIIETYIEEEILVREAKARGFTDSSRIRALLLQNMRFFIGSDVPEPTEEDLRTHFETNIAEFTSPPSLDLNHVMFNDPERVPDDILPSLNEAEDPSELGDLDTRLGYHMRYLDQRRLVGLFGVETAKDLLSIPVGDNTWRGPIEAPDGTLHFLRVANRNLPHTPEFETAKDWISTHWLSSKTRELLDASLDKMRQNYRIEIQPADIKTNG